MAKAHVGIEGSELVTDCMGRRGGSQDEKRTKYFNNVS
jgi:hypothetical protein